MRLRKSSLPILILSVLCLSGGKGGALEPTPRKLQSPQSEHSNLGKGETEHQKPVTTPTTPQQSPITCKGGTPAADETISTKPDQVPALQSTDFWQTVFNGVLIVETFFLAWFAFKLVSVTDEMKTATSAAANAANASTVIARHSNRPFLFITDMWMEFPEIPDTHMHVIHFRVRNYGLGPANVRDYVAEVEPMIWPKGTKDPEVWHGPDEGIGLHNPLILGEGIVDDRFKGVVMLDAAEMAALVGAERKLRIEGRIRYKGSAPDHEYITKFYWWYIPFEKDISSFVRSFTPGYNDFT